MGKIPKAIWAAYCRLQEIPYTSIADLGLKKREAVVGMLGRNNRFEKAFNRMVWEPIEATAESKE